MGVSKFHDLDSIKFYERILIERYGNQITQFALNSIEKGAAIIARGQYSDPADPDQDLRRAVQAIHNSGITKFELAASELALIAIDNPLLSKRDIVKRYAIACGHEIGNYQPDLVSLDGGDCDDDEPVKIDGEVDVWDLRKNDAEFRFGHHLPVSEGMLKAFRNRIQDEFGICSGSAARIISFIFKAACAKYGEKSNKKMRADAAVDARLISQTLDVLVAAALEELGIDAREIKKWLALDDEDLTAIVLVLPHVSTKSEAVAFADLPRLEKTRSVYKLGNACKNWLTHQQMMGPAPTLIVPVQKMQHELF